MNTIYVTPAGYTCTCGVTVSCPTGAQSSRRAYQHQHAHLPPEEGNKFTPLFHAQPYGHYDIIDYREVAREHDALKASAAKAMEFLDRYAALVAAFQAENDELRDIITTARTKVEERMDRIRARMAHQHVPGYPPPS